MAVIYGTDGSDVRSGTESGDVIYGWSVAGSKETDTGNDTLNGLGGNDTINGGGGNDVLDGGTGEDRLFGGTGDDIYVVDNTGDAVIEAADAGTDTVVASVSYMLGDAFENLTLASNSSGISGTGNNLDNVLTTNGDSNTLYGLDGNDMLNAVGGAATLFGGGVTIYMSVPFFGAIIEMADQGIDTVRMSASSYTLAENVENLTFLTTSAATGEGNESNNRIIGNSGDDFLSGRGGDDRLEGGKGNDRLSGGNGKDLLIGGTGNDTYYWQPGDHIDERANGGIDTIVTAYNVVLQSQIENVTLAGDVLTIATGNDSANVMRASTEGSDLSGRGGADTLIGSGTDDYLDGENGDDILLGGSGGKDYLYGRAGNDSLTAVSKALLEGGTGDDTYHVSGLDNTIVEAAGEGSDTVFSTVSLTLSDNVENLVLEGTQNLSGTGNAGNNTITGNSGSNTLNGADGNDTLIGGKGNDSYGYTAGDTIVEEAGGGVDTVITSNAVTLAAQIENLSLIGRSHVGAIGNGAANVMTGNDGNNYLRGLGGIDTISGGQGNDTLAGGTGSDMLEGGAGADSFLYRAISEGGDTIADFVAGTDSLAFSASGFGIDLSPRQLGAHMFVADSNPVATRAYAQFLYDTDLQILSFDADGKGAGAAVEILSFDSAVSLSASDIFLI